MKIDIISDVEDSQLIADVERLNDILARFPEPVVKPAMIVVSGLPGTGKTYFCNKVAERFPAIILESDALRKVLFPYPDYTLQESARVFRAVHRLAEDLLRRGFPLIVDATNLSEKNRENLYSIAEHLGVKLILVRVEAPPELVRKRLEERQNAETRSDADWAIYQKMKSSLQPIRRNHYVVDTSKDITPVIDKIVREAEKAQF